MTGQTPIVGDGSRRSITAAIRQLREGVVTPTSSDIRSLVGAAAGAGGPGPDDIDRELTDAGLSYLISLVEPLRTCVATVSGDADALAAKSAEWQDVATQLRGSIPDITSSSATAGPSWTGSAADAFTAAMSTFSSAIDDAAQAADGVAGLVGSSAELMGGARELVSDIYARVSEYLVTLEAASAAAASHTMGASGDVALVSMLGEVSQGLDDALDIVDRVSALLRRIATGLEEAGALFEQLGGLLDVLAQGDPGSRADATPDGREGAR